MQTLHWHSTEFEPLFDFPSKCNPLTCPVSTTPNHRHNISHAFRGSYVFIIHLHPYPVLCIHLHPYRETIHEKITKLWTALWLFLIKGFPLEWWLISASYRQVRDSLEFAFAPLGITKVWAQLIFGPPDHPHPQIDERQENNFYIFWSKWIIPWYCTFARFWRQSKYSSQASISFLPHFSPSCSLTSSGCLSWDYLPVFWYSLSDLKPLISIRYVWNPELTICASFALSLRGFFFSWESSSWKTWEGGVFLQTLEGGAEKTERRLNSGWRLPLPQNFLNWLFFFIQPSFSFLNKCQPLCSGLIRCCFQDWNCVFLRLNNDE